MNQTETTAAKPKRKRRGVVLIVGRCQRWLAEPTDNFNARELAILTADERLFVGRVTIWDGQRLRLRNDCNDLLFRWDRVQVFKLLKQLPAE